MTTEKITAKQLKLLSGFTCERLSATPANRKMVRSFDNTRNPGLSETLKRAWNEDKSGKTAYYIVKDAAGDVLLFFSLKCGVLYNPNFLNIVKREYNKAKALYNAVMNKPNVPKWAQEHVEKLRASGALHRGGLEEIVVHYFRMKGELDQLKKALKQEQQDEGSMKIVRTDRTYAGIELVHFCANERYRKKWKALNLGRPMGETLFWHFVVPTFLQINSFIGCEYVYLFAADSTEDRTLINYYENALQFTRPDDIGTTKPFYDFSCVFMCQELTMLKAYSSYFFQTFNRTDPV